MNNIYLPATYSGKVKQRSYVNNIKSNDNKNKKYKRNYFKDVTIYGLLYFIIFLIFYFYTNYNTYKKGYYKFKIYHLILWNILLISQIFYIFNILFFKEKLSITDKNVYNLLTKGGLHNISLIVKEADEWPLYDAFFILIVLLVPTPYVDTSTWSKLFEALFAKIGIYHVINRILNHYLKL